MFSILKAMGGRPSSLGDQTDCSKGGFGMPLFGGGAIGVIPLVVVES
jgi:hypothetical protein